MSDLNDLERRLAALKAPPQAAPGPSSALPFDQRAAALRAPGIPLGELESRLGAIKGLPAPAPAPPPATGPFLVPLGSTAPIGGYPLAGGGGGGRGGPAGAPTVSSAALEEEALMAELASVARLQHGSLPPPTASTAQMYGVDWTAEGDDDGFDAAALMAEALSEAKLVMSQVPPEVHAATAAAAGKGGVAKPVHHIPIGVGRGPGRPAAKNKQSVYVDNDDESPLSDEEGEDEDDLSSDSEGSLD